MTLPQYLTSLPHFLPETIMGIGFCVAIVAGLIWQNSRRAVPAVNLLTLVASGYFLTRPGAGGATLIFSDMYAVDNFSVFFKGVIIATAIFITIFSMQFGELNARKRHVGEYYAILLAGTLGMMLMTSANNLLMMYLSLELTSISSYILTGYTREARDSAEASLKYVIYGALSSGLMLYGISIMYGLTATFDLTGINHMLMTGQVNAAALIISGILILAGFGYKISAVPFHFWTPDVYEGAPVTITAFLSVASKAAGFAMMIRFLKLSFFDPLMGTLSFGANFSIASFQWNDVLAILSVLTMTVGNLVAIWQKNLKRLLAYSSIAHAGYMLLGVVVLGAQGITAVLIYFVVYLFMNLGAFYIVMIVANRIGTEDIDAYKGLGRRAPVISVAMTIFLLSLTGIPPTAGFIGKLYLFSALIGARWFWLAIVAALNSVISLYYYVRILRNMYLRDPEGDSSPIEFPVTQVIMILVLVIPTLLLGIYFSPLVDLAQSTVAMFFIH